jgi:hypothetical protein
LHSHFSIASLVCQLVPLCSNVEDRPALIRGGDHSGQQLAFLGSRAIFGKYRLAMFGHLHDNDARIIWLQSRRSATGLEPPAGRSKRAY